MEIHIYFLVLATHSTLSFKTTPTPNSCCKSAMVICSRTSQNRLCGPKSGTSDYVPKTFKLREYVDGRAHYTSKNGAYTLEWNGEGWEFERISGQKFINAVAKIDEPCPFDIDPHQWTYYDNIDGGTIDSGDYLHFACKDISKNDKWDINVGYGKWTKLQTVDTACGPQWYGWSQMADVGSISTTLYKSSKCGKLDFGNCWSGGTVRVYLAGKLIGEAGPNTPSQIIEFAIPATSLLEIKDEGDNSVIKFTNFEMMDCSGKFKTLLLSKYFISCLKNHLNSKRDCPNKVES